MKLQSFATVAIAIFFRLTFIKQMLTRFSTSYRFKTVSNLKRLSAVRRIATYQTMAIFISVSTVSSLPVPRIRIIWHRTLSKPDIACFFRSAANQFIARSAEQITARHGLTR